MHDGMPYDPIQGQGQGHGASEVPKIALFKLIFSVIFVSDIAIFVLKRDVKLQLTNFAVIYRGSWQMTKTRAQYLNLIGPDF